SGHECSGRVVAGPSTLESALKSHAVSTRQERNRMRRAGGEIVADHYTDFRPGISGSEAVDSRDNLDVSGHWLVDEAKLIGRSPRVRAAARNGKQRAAVCRGP